MTTDEIARELREWNECHLSDMCIETDSQCWKFCNDGDCIAVQAADLIESLQAKLAESQRRERAAVEDLNGLARFERERCAYCLYDEECEPGEMLCSYKGDKAFEWRGPQGAEKGERK